jgi:NADH:ubiquinone oxidoreductase subunit 6 (subunit J)
MILAVVGLTVGGYGVALMLDEPRVILLRIVVWAGAGVVLHDFVFAPLCVALGFAGRRLVPRRWWAPAAIAALCSVILVLLAIPVFDRPGARPDNRTVLDRNYPLGLWISLAVVWSCVPLYLAAVHLRAHRSGELGPRPADPPAPTVG